MRENPVWRKSVKGGLGKTGTFERNLSKILYVAEMPA
jgi:hypothetical protein